MPDHLSGVCDADRCVRLLEDIGDARAQREEACVPPPYKFWVTKQSAALLRAHPECICTRFRSSGPIECAELSDNETLVCVLWGDTTIVEVTDA